MMNSFEKDKALFLKKSVKVKYISIVYPISEIGVKQFQGHRRFENAKSEKDLALRSEAVSYLERKFLTKEEENELIRIQGGSDFVSGIGLYYLIGNSIHKLRYKQDYDIKLVEVIEYEDPQPLLKWEDIKTL